MGMGVLIKTKDAFLLEGKTVEPSKQEQIVTPDDGYYGLSYVKVQPVSDEFSNISDASAVESDILAGKTAYINGGKVEGTMTNNGAIAAEIDGLEEVAYTIPAGYHDGNGSVSLSSSIEAALSVI